MKIGFSFSKCVRDILAGKVKEDDVVCIITRTIMDPEHFEQIISGYGAQTSESGGRNRGYLQDFDLDTVMVLTQRLWDAGKIHQPRKFTRSIPLGVSDQYAWMDLFPTNLSDNPSVEQAWKNYRMILKLADGSLPDIEGAQQEVMRPNGLCF